MRVLFVCVGNSCRSQMAEAVARKLGLEAASAGTEPTTAVNAEALAVLADNGYETSTLAPKHIDQFDLTSFARTITMGCGVAESCPTLRTDEDWGLDDPVGQPREIFAACLREIEQRVAKLAADSQG